MCGRFTFGTQDVDVAEVFGAIAAPVGLRPRYNVAPTDPVPVIRNRHDGNDARIIELIRWGLVPRWAKDPSMGAKMINARAQTLAEKPAFRDAFKHRRCLVLADGFYEWQRQGRERLPFRVCRKDGGPMAFAGLWERWRRPRAASHDDWLISCSVITCPPNELVRPLHDRMPLILEPEDYNRWLSPEALPAEALGDLLVTPSAEELEIQPVSKRVNSVRHDDPACLAREPVQQSLF